MAQPALSPPRLMESAKPSRTWGSELWRWETRTRRWTAPTSSSQVRLQIVSAPGDLAQGSRVWEIRRSQVLIPNSLWPSNLGVFPDSGREFFVGLSKWTNHRGAEIVADTFRVRSQNSLGRERCQCARGLDLGSLRTPKSFWSL